MGGYLQQCAYWSTLAWKCEKREGGLFIPMDDHIQQFCLSENGYACPQLQSSDTPRPEKATFWENRRKYSRIKTQKPLILSTLTPAYFETQPGQHEEFSCTEEFPAKTLDISAGGMRLFANTSISQHAPIEFSFDKNFPEQLKKAKGKVQWCNKQIDEPGYQIGIAFAESQTNRVVEKYLQAHLVAS